MIIHITSCVVKMLCPVGRENAKKERRAEARLPFPPSPISREFRMRETLVLDAADVDFFIKFIEINISK